MTEDGPAIDDRATRSKLASWAVKASGLKYTSYRAVSALSKGERPGPENSIGKLVAGMMLQDIASYAMDLQGAAGALTGAAEEKAAGQFQQMLLSAPSIRIAGGTDEILRNIIAERVLGLPGDIRVDKDVPFNKIPTKGRLSMTEAAAKTPKARLRQRGSHRRARGALERALLRPRLPAAAVPRETIEHLLTIAQRTASWCNSQPWQVLIASGEAKERFRKLIYAEAASGAEDGHDFPPPREYLGVYLERRRESGFQLYNTLGIAQRRQGRLRQASAGELQFLRRAACRHHSHRRAARGLRRGRLRRLCRQFHAGRPGPGPRHHSAGGAGAAFPVDPPPLQARRRPQGGLRHFVRIRRQRPKVNSYRTSRAGIADTVTFVEE